MTLSTRIAALEARRGTSAVSAGIILFDPFSETPEDAVARARPGVFAVVPVTLPADPWSQAVEAGQRRLAALATTAIQGDPVDVPYPFG
jgi:hypothetical protein